MKKLTVMENLINQRTISANQVFNDHFLDTKNLYLYFFNHLPCRNMILPIDAEKAFAAFEKEFCDSIERIYKTRWFRRKKKAYEFDVTIVRMKNNCLLEFDDNYCEILHDGAQNEFIERLTNFLLPFKQRQRRQPLEINLIIKDRKLELRAMEIKRSKLNIDLFYEDDFKHVDELIRKRLNTNNDKGIVLLHGLPGSGKTTYLRYLIGKIKKRVLFLSPSVAESLTSPDFIELLIDNPNTVLIIEDAENIIMDRKINSGSSVSNLLNISDGLLADFLNVQLVCTFNSALTLIDSALMRKGRLIAKYEFGKLGIEKAQRLSNHLGFKTLIHKPMTVAEISNQHEKEQKDERIEVMGFKRHLLEN